MLIVMPDAYKSTLEAESRDNVMIITIEEHYKPAAVFRPTKEQAITLAEILLRWSGKKE